MTAAAPDRAAPSRFRAAPVLRLAVVLALAVACGRGGAKAERAEPSAGAGANPAGETLAATSPDRAAPLLTGPAPTPEDRMRCEEEEERRIRDGQVTPIVVPEAPARIRATPKRHASGYFCEKEAAAAGFRTSTHWSEGCFVNLFYAPNPDTLVDLSTGLMWQRHSSDESLPHAKAVRLIATLNSKRFGGHTGWRFPTTDELFSIIERPIESTDNVHRLAGNNFHLWWSADGVEDEADVTAYLLEYHADCRATEHDHQRDLVAVRTVPDDELSVYREAVRKGGLKAQLAGRAILPAHDKGKP